MDGGGGSGPALTRARFKRAPDDAALISLIIEGIGTAGMPPSWHLLPDGPRQLAVYVRSLGRVSEPPVAGDVEYGRAVYRKSGCGGCHIARGEGTGFGPELSDIGVRRTAAFLRQALVEPKGSAGDPFLTVVLEPRGGSEIRGIRVNEDSFTIQVKDPGGAFHSFRKAELVKLEKRFGETLMPGYGNLPAVDLQNLVSYLVSLRGEQ